MEALLCGCMAWAPRNAHYYRQLWTAHHKLLLRVIGYRRIHGTYRHMSYAKALKKTRSQSVKATIRQRRLLFARALARQGDKRLPKRLLFAGKLEGGPGQPAQHWQKSLRDDFKAFRALHGSTPTDRQTFGVDRVVWTDAARKEEGVPLYAGVLLGAGRFMVSWHKGQEEASRLREVNRAAKALLANQKTNLEEGGGERERESKCRRGAINSSYSSSYSEWFSYSTTQLPSWSDGVGSTSFLGFSCPHLLFGFLNLLL